MTTYKEAGVDVAAGETAVKRIKNLARSTFNDQVLTGIGGFGGCFKFPVSNYNEPVLVSSADGIGTKLKIAFLTGTHNTVGQCLVNHCVNDILATGAVPLYFLDYFAAGKLDVNVFEEVVSGLAKACRENHCALIGGETAEMPDFYSPGEYDLSGTIVGAVEEYNLLGHRKTEKGDKLIGLFSSGLHTNGYSLARKVLLGKFKCDEYVDELQNTVGDELLKIHRSYLPVLRQFINKDWLKGISHITGGGIINNTRRIISDDQKLQINWESWDWLPIFKLIQEIGQVPLDDMRLSFNLGIGLILVINPDGLPEMSDHLKSIKEPWIEIGYVD